MDKGSLASDAFYRICGFKRVEVWISYHDGEVLGLPERES